MPTNRFPDSLEKRELRRIDGRRVEKFAARHELSLGLTYCGMPSVEFLDVRCWLPQLRSVEAIEIDEGVYEDMRIQWNALNLPLTCNLRRANIYEYLTTTDQTFDLYNLDFYGGFLNKRRAGGTNATDALKGVITRHGTKQHSFVLICTFNVRETAVKEYDRFIDELPTALAGCKNVSQNCAEHKTKSYYRTKLGFTYFCWDVGRSHGFNVYVADVFIYQSSVPLLHFYCEFEFVAQALPTAPSVQALASIANKPLKRLVGLVPSIEFRPAQIDVPK